MADVSSDGKADRRLSSWKEIAAFFGKDARTVKRWEQRGLPVRRLPKGTRSSVFAYSSELEEWLRSPRQTVAADAEIDVAAESSIGAAPEPRRPSWPIAAAAAVALMVAGVLTIGQLTQAPPVVARHVAPAEAQALYQSGVIAWSSRTAAGFDEAITDFDAALAIDPQYAAAYVGLANVYNLLSQYTDAPATESYAKAATAADTALALDPELAEAYAAKGFNLYYGSHEFERSAQMFEEAVKRAPDSAQTLHWYALTSMHMDDQTRPLELIGRALELSPDSRTIRANRALILFYAGRADDAVAALKAQKQAEPDYLGTPSYLATIYLAQGRYPEFLQEYAEAARVENNAARLRIAEAASAGLASGGGNGFLRAMLAAQQTEYAAGAEPAFKLAVTAALLGDEAAALEYLTTSVERGEPDSLSVRLEPAFERYYGDARFVALVEKVGFKLPN
jgi:tetratricopeptide (TPR) repeat protein